MKDGRRPCVKGDPPCNLRGKHRACNPFRHGRGSETHHHSVTVQPPEPPPTCTEPGAATAGSLGAEISSKPRENTLKSNEIHEISSKSEPKVLLLLPFCLPFPSPAPQRYFNRRRQSGPTSTPPLQRSPSPPNAAAVSAAVLGRKATNSTIFDDFYLIFIRFSSIFIDFHRFSSIFIDFLSVSWFSPKDFDGPTTTPIASQPSTLRGALRLFGLTVSSSHPHAAPLFGRALRTAVGPRDVLLVGTSALSKPLKGSPKG